MSIAEAEIFIKEGRLLALELMGHLLTQYRGQVIRPPVTPPPNR